MKANINNIEEFVAEHKRQNPHLYRAMPEDAPALEEETVVESPVDCRSFEGMIVGLIDSIIFTARALVKFDPYWADPDIAEALKDLRADEDVRSIMSDR